MTTQTATAVRTLDIDRSHSDVAFQVRHLLSKVRGRFADFSGTIHFDESAPQNSKVDVAIQAASIETAEADRDKHLRSADFFDAEKYSTLRFVSTSVVPRGDNTYDVAGNLTIRGQTRPATFDVTYNGSWRQHPVGIPISGVGFTAVCAGFNGSDPGLPTICAGFDGSGVGFTRDPATGANDLYLDFLPNAQGEDVVSGRCAVRGRSGLEESQAGLYRELRQIQRQLELLFRDVQDFEFTVQEGRLYLLQSRSAKRTALAFFFLSTRIARTIASRDNSEGISTGNPNPVSACLTLSDKPCRARSMRFWTLRMISVVTVRTCSRSDSISLSVSI